MPAKPPARSHRSAEEISARRQYVDDRWRAEAFVERCSADQMERYFRERMGQQSGLFG